MRYLPNQYINPALTIRDREMDTSMAEPYDPRPLTPKEVEEKQKNLPPGSPYEPNKSPIPSKNVMRNNNMTIAGAQDLDTKQFLLPSGMFVDENQIKYMWSPRERKFIDMGPYDPYYDGLPIPMGKRNSDMKIAGLPHTPPSEKMVVGKKLMDSPLRFRTDAERIRFMEDFAKYDRPRT